MIYFLLLLTCTLLISFPIFHYLIQKRDTSILFVSLCNVIFLFSTILFFYGFHEKILTLVSSCFLVGYSFILFYKLKNEQEKYYSLGIVYPIFCIFSLFYFLF